MARPPAGRGPSPRDDARRRGWDDEPRGRGEDAPWLDEADEEEDGATHTLVGRRTLFGILFLLGVLTIGVIVGIGLVSDREDTPIDVPAVGEEVPVLASPGPWKITPTGPDVEGIPVDGQGQVLFGTGDGRETEAAIDTGALPEDPLPRPGTEVEALPAVDEALEPAERPAPAQPVAVAPPAPKAAPKPAAPKPSDIAVPRDVPAKAPQPKVIEAPRPEARAPEVRVGGGGSVLQLGAFSSESRARSAFKSLSSRFAYLSGMEPMIVPTSADGKTLYRLRTAAPSSAVARDICGRLRVAGEACSVVD